MRISNKNHAPAFWIAPALSALYTRYKTCQELPARTPIPIPKGLCPPAQGCELASYPGRHPRSRFQPRRGCAAPVCIPSACGPNPRRNVHSIPYPAAGATPAIHAGRRCTSMAQLLRSWRPHALIPRVARSSQPWAGGRNPFGIGKRDLRVRCASPLALCEPPAWGDPQSGRGLPHSRTLRGKRTFFTS
jgi:hypothetical protein